MHDGLRAVPGGDSLLPIVLPFHVFPTSYLWDDDTVETDEKQGKGGWRGEGGARQRNALVPLLHSLLATRRSLSVQFQLQPSERHVGFLDDKNEQALVLSPMATTVSTRLPAGWLIQKPKSGLQTLPHPQQEPGICLWPPPGLARMFGHTSQGLVDSHCLLSQSHQFRAGFAINMASSPFWRLVSCAHDTNVWQCLCELIGQLLHRPTGIRPFPIARGLAWS